MEGSIHLGREVIKVDVNEDEGCVYIYTKDGQVMSAHSVIVTVPLGVLKSGSIEFQPPLSQEKKTAIDQAGIFIYVCQQISQVCDGECASFHSDA